MPFSLRPNQKNYFEGSTISSRQMFWPRARGLGPVTLSDAQRQRTDCRDPTAALDKVFARWQTVCSRRMPGRLGTRFGGMSRGTAPADEQALRRSASELTAKAEPLASTFRLTARPVQNGQELPAARSICG